VERGLITQVELDAADAEWQRFRVTALEAGAAIDSERLALNRSIGLPAATMMQIQAVELPAPPPEASAEDVATMLERNRLDLLALRLGYESEESKVRSAVLSQFPKISVGVAAARDTSNVISLGPSVTLDLPLFDRAQGRIAIEQATRQQLFDEYVSRTFEARSDIARLRSELTSVAQRIEATDAYVKRLQSLQQTYAAAVQRGDADVLNLHQVQSTLADTTLDALRLRQEQAELIIGLEVAQGEMFTTGAPR
jgi:outer membrane protein TolC